jgi:hypothetical protein
VLTVRALGAFKNGFDLVDDEAGSVGGFRGSAWREHGDIVVGRERLGFRRHGGRRFTLESPSGVLATAVKPSRWSGRWEITLGDRTYELAKRSLMSRTVEVRGRGQVLGEVRPKGVFGGNAAVELPAELPVPVQVFVIAVVLTLWRRDETAGASAATAGGAAAASG